MTEGNGTPRPAAIPAVMRRLRPWVVFFGVLGAVWGAVFILSLVAVIFRWPVGSWRGLVRGLPGAIGYLLWGGFDLLLTVRLFRLAGEIARYTAEPRDDLLATALAVQYTCWKLLGIMVITWFTVVTSILVWHLITAG